MWFWSNVRYGLVSVSYRMGCTAVFMHNGEGRPFRVIVRGHFPTIDTLAYAIDNGKQFKAWFLD